MRVLLVLAVGVVVLVLALWILQRRIIYLPTQAIPPLGELAPDGEEVTYTTADGLTLRGWYLPPSGGPLGVTVLVLPGNAGNRALRVPLADAIAEAGAGVLLVDYRGYGGNPGRPSEEGLARDADAAVAYLESRSDVDPDRIVYLGESLGAAVAVGLARRRTPAALVLRSPFSSLADVAAHHYRVLPVRLLLRDELPVADVVAEVEAPLLVVAGAADRIVPVEQSRRVHEAARGPKELVVLDAADHNDPDLGYGPELVDAIVRFLVEHVGPPDGEEGE